ncbi:tRNA endonuclease ANKZF1 isoform X1 [Pleurodeles waltl]|uniref:tRNA endonuclease ANKZF1 isoform X1 n=1 Tax=Pleurodeles waltl TaxID=8319 RepID=UPI00370977C5
MESRSLFELPLGTPLLDGLSLVNASARNDYPDSEGNTRGLMSLAEPALNERKGVTVIPEVSDRMFCSTCQCAFESREEQMEHYKLDWHRFNLKRRIVGGSTITAEEFEDRTNAGDLSSISGSDSDSSSEDEKTEVVGKNEVEASSTQMDLMKQKQRRQGPSNRFLFRNSEGQLLAVYQCVLGPAKERTMDASDLVQSLKSLQAKPCWVILMAGGGHFAGAVFRGNEVLEHKTFHRYTVRAKRGTSQGLRDGQSRSNMPKSAGASLRRYNEAALLKDVQDLLESWSLHLQNARAIFLRAPSHNKTIFFSKKNAPFQKNDPRVYNVPFVTRRATFKEVQRVHTMLSMLQVYGKDTLVTDITSPQKKEWKKVKKPPAEEPPSGGTGTSSLPSEEEDEDVMEREMDMVEVTIGTLDLREFEVMPKRNHKKKKKSGRKSARDSSAKETEDSIAVTDRQTLVSAPTLVKGPELEPGCRRQPKAPKDHSTLLEADEASYQLRNDLFTACKAGDADLLQRLLREVLGCTTGIRTQGQTDVPAISDLSASITNQATPQKMPTLTNNNTGVNTTQVESEPEILKSSSVVDQLDCCAGAEDERPHTQALVSTDNTHLSHLVNERIDTGGFTLLHVAAAAGQSSIMTILMDAGWDPALRDNSGQTPFSVSTDKLTRNAFRKYRAEHPEKFNYIKAQIPEPLTAELEAKKEEKKRAQKLLKKQREKAEKEDKKRKEEEEAEKKRFAALSDREKRALAAERRLAAQLSSTGATITNTRRCWQCGETLMGKVPFEYMEFSFCSTRCLQEHRKASRAAKS